jgi:hypothetical protein
MIHWAFLSVYVQWRAIVTIQMEFQEVEGGREKDGIE